jgi:hypothetical protein
VAIGGWKPRLRDSVPAPPENAPDRQAEASRQVVSLVEASRHGAPRVQRNGDDRVGAFEDFRSRFLHHRGQRSCQDAPPFVFERVDDLPQGPAVLAGASGRCERQRPMPARHAQKPWHLPARKSVATTRAKGRRDQGDRPPARVAYRAAERAFENRVTRRTSRREEDANQRIGDGKDDIVTHGCLSLGQLAKLVDTRSQ